MEVPDQKADAASRVVAILRKATRIVQIVPFLYLGIYGFYMIGSVLLSDDLVCLADSFLFTSPVVTWFLLGLSKLFKLCRWHKAACLFPSSSQVGGFIDEYVVTFTQNEIILVNVAIGLTVITFLVLAYRHFFTDGR